MEGREANCGVGARLILRPVLHWYRKMGGAKRSLW